MIKLSKNATRVVALLLLVALTLLSFAACKKDEPIPTKEEIIAKMTAEDQPEHSHAIDYLKSWGLSTGIIYNSKFKSVEAVYKSSYYKADELKSPFLLATATAELFLERFYGEVDLTNEKELSDALISCYVASIGDDYSVYRTAAEDDEYTTDMSGSFVGIGVAVIYSYVDETITVSEVYIGSGAADAGILPGDLIIKADGKSLEEIGYNKMISTIRGEEGTRVKVTVLRNGVELEFDVERKKVIEKSVSYEILDGNIGYVKITSFKDNTASQFKTAIDELEAAGVCAVIYDLRSNSGGYLHAVVEMLEYVAPVGTRLVSFSNDYANPINSYDAHTFLIPSVVLCNEYTASAGELFTAAIRDFSDMGMFDATLVGKNTFGKGIMQSGVNFTDGSSLTFTVAYYNPPCGINYHGTGIAPDVEVSLTEEGDVQLDAAIEAAKALTNTNTPS